jgi:hypothetical protein
MKIIGKQIKIKKIVLFFIILINLSSNYVFANKNEATNNIKIAEDKIIESYELLKRGANIKLNLTSHINKLNQAITYLDQSKTHLSNEDYEKSLHFSEDSIRIIDELNISLDQILINEENNIAQLKLLNMVIKVVALIILGIIFLVLYKYLERQSHKKMLKMKPEVKK